MKHKWLFLLVFITSASLLLASVTPKEQVEKACADDYGTYVHPGPPASHVTSNTSGQIGELPARISRFIFTWDDLNEGGSVGKTIHLKYCSYIPIYLSCRQIRI